MDGLHDIDTVTLLWNDQMQLLEGLAGDDQWVAFGGERKPLHRSNVVVQHLCVCGRGGGGGDREEGRGVREGETGEKKRDVCRGEGEEGRDEGGGGGKGE